MFLRSASCHPWGVPDAKPKPRRKTGKRSDEGYSQVNLLLPEALRRELKARAALEGRDMSTIVEQLLREYLAADPT